MQTRILVICSILFLSLASLQTAVSQSKPDTVEVVLSTSMGDLRIALFANKAPITVKNFLSYVDSGFYAGTTFHRVIPGFVIQGGGYTSDLHPKRTFPPIQNESNNGLSNEYGTLSMARTSDPHSATSQFFINLARNRSLDYGPRGWGYAVFGKVIDGMDVVEKIAAVPRTNRDVFQDVPIEPVVITSAKREK